MKCVFLLGCLYFLGGLLMAEGNDEQLTGKVVWPNSPEYDNARLVSNYYPSKNKYPDVIIYCQNREDVVHAVNWARNHKKIVRIRSGAHNHEGFSTGHGVVIIDVSQMKKIEVISDKVIIEPGLTNGELYRILYEKKLTHVGGTCSDVGSSGLVLSGGMGPLLRKHGLTCDNLLSLDIVLADGRTITATAENEHQDLFWACRGGGAGNFGVVVGMHMKIYPAENVTWFNIEWDWEAPVEQIFHAWQDFFEKQDQRWFSHLDIWGKSFPVELTHKQPVKILGVFWGIPDQAQKELEPILKIATPKSTLFETVSWVQAIKQFEDSTAVFLTKKPQYKSTGAFAPEKLPHQAVSIITNILQNSTTPLLNVLVFSMGGAMAEIPVDATAFYYRRDKFFLSYNSQWLNEDEDTKQIEEVDNLRQRLLPYTEGDYIGNPDRNFTDYLTVYYGDNAQRLKCVKLKYDPQQLFQYEQSVTPASFDKNCDSLSK